jgi:hypothetical protein
MEDKHFSCENCNQVFCHHYPNGGKLCTGIVQETIRNCDLVRVCQVYEDGKTYNMDIAIDEAAVHIAAMQMALAQALRFFYKRPCADCQEKTESCGTAAFAYNIGGTVE